MRMWKAQGLVRGAWGVQTCSVQAGWRGRGVSPLGPAIARLRAPTPTRCDSFFFGESGLTSPNVETCLETFLGGKSAQMSKGMSRHFCQALVARLWLGKDKGKGGA